MPQRPSSGRGEDRNFPVGTYVVSDTLQRPSSGRGEDRNVSTTVELGTVSGG